MSEPLKNLSSHVIKGKKKSMKLTIYFYFKIFLKKIHKEFKHECFYY